ncbi:hypothetical protein [Lysobacter gummosus]|uniref:hypothetical protein n=1 Tax=Lysobacter gummosus TaxID=262324 RepID=UPI00363479ED
MAIAVSAGAHDKIEGAAGRASTPPPAARPARMTARRSRNGRARGESFSHPGCSPLLPWPRQNLQNKRSGGEYRARGAPCEQFAMARIVAPLTVPLHFPVF